MKHNKDYVSFENTYGDVDENGNAFITIDGYPEDDNEEGTVIATVFLTPHKDFVVDFHNNGYRLNEDVLNLIEDSKKQLLENYQTPAPYEYYKVQEVERKYLGHRTYSEGVTDTHLFEKNEIRKALAIYKKRVANDIIYYRTVQINEAPYAYTVSIFGEKEWRYDSNGTPHQVVAFKNKDHNIDFFIPLSSKISADDLMTQEEYYNKPKKKK